MQGSLVLPLHLQTQKINFFYATVKWNQIYSIDIITQRKLLTRLHGHDCRWIVLLSLTENGGRPKYTHVRHKFGGHPGPHYPMCLSVRFRHCSESEKTRQRTGNGTKFKMSAEEDTELRDMVAQTLESKGVLGKIRVWKCTISIKCYVISKLWQSEYIFNSICHAILFRTYGANIPLQLTMTNFCL